MKRILVVLLLLVIGVVGLGFYLGWFHLSTDEEKIRKDIGKAEEKIEEAGQTIKEKTGIGADKSKKEDSKPEPPPK